MVCRPHGVLRGGRAVPEDRGNSAPDRPEAPSCRESRPHPAPVPLPPREDPWGREGLEVLLQFPAAGLAYLPPYCLPGDLNLAPFYWAAEGLGA